MAHVAQGRHERVTISFTFASQGQGPERNGKEAINRGTVLFIIIIPRIRPYPEND